MTAPADITVTKELINLFTYLLPGFIAVWIFYQLTPHRKPTGQAQIVQALIFTFVIQSVANALFTACLSFTDYRCPIIPEFLTLPFSIIIGIAAARLANHDIPHRWLRKCRITDQSASPSNWNHAFTNYYNRHVVLHLRDQRRLYGWMQEWPDFPDDHFLMTRYAWLSEQGGPADAEKANKNDSLILVDAKDVALVEFVKKPEKTDAPKNQ